MDCIWPLMLIITGLWSLLPSREDTPRSVIPLMSSVAIARSGVLVVFHVREWKVFGSSGLLIRMSRFL